MNIDKLTAKIETVPWRSDITYDELILYLMHHGFWLVHSRGSHRQFKNTKGSAVTIVQKTPVKEYLVKECVKVVHQQEE